MAFAASRPAQQVSPNMASPSPSPSASIEPTEDSATDGVILALIVGSITTVICLVVFEILRHYVPTVFEFRQALRDRGEKTGHRGENLKVPDPPSKVPLVGWIQSTLQQTPEKLEITHGLDAAFFVRYLRSKVVLHFVLTFLCCVVLIPIYWTAANKDLPETDELRTQGFQVVSLGNIPSDNSWRFYVAFSVYVLSAVLTVIATLLDYKAYDQARRRYRASNDPSNFAVLFQDIPVDMATEEKILAYWDGLFPGKVEYVHHVLNANKIVKKQAKWLNAVTRRERAEWEVVNNPKLRGSRPTHKVGTCVCCKGGDAVVDSIEYWAEQQEHYAQKITRCQKEKDPAQLPHSRSAIVVFKTKRAASIAAQVLFARKDSEWCASRAAEPNAINYSVLAISNETKDIRKLAVQVALFLLTVFWSVITIAVQGLANITALAETEIKVAGGGTIRPFAFLSFFGKATPNVKAFVQGLLPVIVQSVLTSLVPIIIRVANSFTRTASRAKLEGEIRDFFSFFLFFNGFLFVLLGGAFIQSLPDLVKLVSPIDFVGIANLLAKAVPSQGSYFMAFALVKALSENMMQLHQIGRVVIRWALRKFLCKTPRQLNAKDYGGSIFLYFRYYAFAQLLSIISLTYSAVSPILVPCCLCYYVTAYLVFTHNLSYTCVQPFDGGGEMFQGSVKSTFTGLVVQSMVMGGLFGLKQQPTLSTLSFVCAGIVLIPFLYMRRRFPRVVEHGSLVETALADAEKGGEKRISSSVARLYRHPGMEPVPNPVENLSGLSEDQRLSLPHKTSPAVAAEKAIIAAEHGEDIENAFAAGKVDSVTATSVIGAAKTGGGSVSAEPHEPSIEAAPFASKKSSVYLDAKGDTSAI